MINWVESICRVWGSDQQRIMLGGRWVRSVHGREWHFDGAPPRSIQDKIFREHFAALCGAIEQHYPEVQSSEAWHVHRVYVELGIRDRIMMVGRYVARAHWKSIAHKSGYIFEDGRINKDDYYRAWDRLHTKVDSVPREHLADSVRELSSV